MIRCNHCDIVFIHPQPVRSRIAKNNKLLYESERLLLAYFNKKEELTRRAEKCIEFLSKYKKNGKVLDIGCSYGFYLNTFKERGYNSIGIDTSKKAVNYAKRQFRLRVLAGDFETHVFNSKSFEIITLFDVIEHLPKPQIAISKINNILKENGIIVIQTPNIRSIISRLTGLKWFWLLIPQHLFLYSVKSLKFLLENNGFSVIKVYTWDDIYEFIDNILLNLRIRNNGRTKILYFIIFKILFLLLPISSYLWNKLYLGAAIVIYAQKTK